VGATWAPDRRREATEAEEEVSQVHVHGGLRGIRG